MQDALKCFKGMGNVIWLKNGLKNMSMMFQVMRRRFPSVTSNTSSRPMGGGTTPKMMRLGLAGLELALKKHHLATLGDDSGNNQAVDELRKQIVDLGQRLA